MSPYPIITKIPAGGFDPNFVSCTPKELISKTGGGSFSGIDMDETEGIVIKSKCKTFQILNRRQEKPDDYQSKIDAYDKFVKYLCEWYILSEHYLPSDGDYITNVAKLFI